MLQTKRMRHYGRRVPPVPWIAPAALLVWCVAVAHGSTKAPAMPSNTTSGAWREVEAAVAPAAAIDGREHRPRGRSHARDGVTVQGAFVADTGWRVAELKSQHTPEPRPAALARQHPVLWEILQPLVSAASVAAAASSMAAGQAPATAGPIPTSGGHAKYWSPKGTAESHGAATMTQHATGTPAKGSHALRFLEVLMRASAADAGATTTKRAEAQLASGEDPQAQRPREGLHSVHLERLVSTEPLLTDGQAAPAVWARYTRHAPGNAPTAALETAAPLQHADAFQSMVNTQLRPLPPAGPPPALVHLRPAPCSDILVWAVEAAAWPHDLAATPYMPAAYTHCLKPGGLFWQWTRGQTTSGESGVPLAKIQSVSARGSGTPHADTEAGLGIRPGSADWHATAGCLTPPPTDGEGPQERPALQAADTAAANVPSQQTLGMNAPDSALDTARLQKLICCTLAAPSYGMNAAAAGKRTSLPQNVSQQEDMHAAVRASSAAVDPRDARDSLQQASGTLIYDTDGKVEGAGRTDGSANDQCGCGVRASTGDAPVYSAANQPEAAAHLTGVYAQGEHGRSLKQIFAANALPVTRTFTGFSSDVEIIGLLGLALRRQQDAAGRDTSATSALASTFRGIGFPFGISFAATNAFGGAVQQSYDFAVATNRAGAAADGIETGRAIGSVPFGDVNVVTDVLTSALVQREIVTPRSPPGPPRRSSTTHPDRADGVGTGLGQSNSSTSGSGISSATQAGVDAGRSANSGMEAALQHERLLDMYYEYAYWNGYMTPFYNQEYDMSYNLDDDGHYAALASRGTGAARSGFGLTRIPRPQELRGSVGAQSDTATGAAPNGGRTGLSSSGSGVGMQPNSSDSTGSGASEEDTEPSNPNPFDVLMATTAEYGRAGLYNYFYSDIYRFLGSYQAGPQILPQTAVGRTRSTSASVENDRAVTSGSSQNAATGLNVVNIAQSISAAIRGVSQSLSISDRFGNSTFTGAPQQPTRYAGAVVGGLTFGRGYFFQAPSTTVTQASSSASIGGSGTTTAGAGGSITSYAAATQYSGARSQILAQSGVENLDFDIAG